MGSDQSLTIGWELDAMLLDAMFGNRFGVTLMAGNGKRVKTLADHINLKHQYVHHL